MGWETCLLIRPCTWQRQDTTHGDDGLDGDEAEGIRCVLVVVDRCDLATQAKQEFADFFAKCYKIPVAKQKTEQVPEVLQVSAASELQQHFDKLTEDSLARCVLVVTLQSFPHLQTTLPPALQETTGESLKKKYQICISCLDALPSQQMHHQTLTRTCWITIYVTNDSEVSLPRFVDMICLLLPLNPRLLKVASHTFPSSQTIEQSSTPATGENFGCG